MTEEKQPTTTISMSRKVNLENLWGPRFKYETAEFYVTVKDLPADMTEAQIAELLDTTKIAWDQVRASLAEQIKRTKNAPQET